MRGQAGRLEGGRARRCGPGRRREVLAALPRRQVDVVDDQRWWRGFVARRLPGQRDGSGLPRALRPRGAGEGPFQASELRRRGVEWARRRWRRRRWGQARARRDRGAGPLAWLAMSVCVLAALPPMPTMKSRASGVSSGPLGGRRSGRAQTAIGSDSRPGGHHRRHRHPHEDQSDWDHPEKHDVIQASAIRASVNRHWGLMGSWPRGTEARRSAARSCGGRGRVRSLASAAERSRRGAGVVERGSLENRWRPLGARGFESHPLRFRPATMPCAGCCLSSSAVPGRSAARR